MLDHAIMHVLLIRIRDWSSGVRSDKFDVCQKYGGIITIVEIFVIYDLSCNYDSGASLVLLDVSVV